MAEPKAKRSVKGTNRKNPDGALDRKTGVQVSLTMQDHAVNEGFAYHLDGTEDLVAAASAYLELRIPAGVEMHIDLFSVWTNIPFLDVTLLENPTVGTPGTNVVPIINRNRAPEAVAAASAIAAFDNPAAISAGTQIIARRTGAGTKDDNSEVLIAANKMILGDKAAPSIYTIQFNNADGADATMSYTLVWHEMESEE